MRTVAAAFAWIERSFPRGTLYLVQWNRKWQAYNLVGGHREPGETARQCLAREIAEELSLVDGEHFVVSRQPLTRVEFRAWSKPAAAWTAYDMTLFGVSITGVAALSGIDANAENRWLTAAELSQGQTTDGRSVSEVATRFFNALGQTTAD